MAMTDHHRNTLRRARVFLVDNLEVDLIIQHLVSKLLLSGADEDNLESRRTKREKIKCLLDLLPRKGDVGYVKFMEVLKEHQTFVYDELNQIDGQHAPPRETSKPAGPIRQPQPVSPSYPSQASGGVYSQPVGESSAPSSLSSQPSPSVGVHPIDQPSMVDFTDSGPTAAAACSQITGDDTGQQIQPGYTAPRSPQAVVSDKALGVLASKLGGEWEQLAIHMGFAQNKLYHWKAGNPHNFWGQVFSMFDSWKKQNANNATISMLIAVLATFEPPLDQAVYRHLYFE